jgi:hypothetical protein
MKGKGLGYINKRRMDVLRLVSRLIDASSRFILTSAFSTSDSFFPKPENSRKRGNVFKNDLAQ